MCNSVQFSLWCFFSPIMDYLLPVLSLFLLSAVSNANLQAQVYWHTVLLNTAMPSAIRDLLHPDIFIDGKIGGGTNVNVDPGADSLSGHYQYVANETDIHDPRATLFFLEKNLHSGAKMTLHFTSARNLVTILPRTATENLPFSSEKTPEILKKFSIEPSSVEAEVMKKTIKRCEESVAAGEQKVCATSLESMVDFSTASLGTQDLVAASTTVGPEAKKEQEYTMVRVRKLAGSELVACHLEPYAYAVYYCHKTQKTTAYNVEMVGKNGAKIEAVAVCHADTTTWNPRHVAFKVLKVKSGTASVCHFMRQDQVVWAHSN